MGVWWVTAGVKCVKLDPEIFKASAAFVAASSMSMTEWFLPVPTFRTEDPGPGQWRASSTARATSETWVRSLQQLEPEERQALISYLRLNVSLGDFEQVA
jgi:hypothetical protein